MSDKREALSDATPIQAPAPVTGQQGQAQQSAQSNPPVVYAVPVYSVGQQQQQQYLGETVPAAAVMSTLPHATIVSVNVARSFGPEPARVICPYCGADVITGVRVTPSLTAHLWALGLCVFGCWPCCIVPYFVNDCQSHVHICPNCNHEIGFHGL